MFFSRIMQVVFKTSGGKAWNPPDKNGVRGLVPLSNSQKRNRKKNIEQTLKNLSILKMAELNRPHVPVRLYKPLHHWRLLWMKKRLELTKKVLGWGQGREQQEEGVRARIQALIPSQAVPATTGRHNSKLFINSFASSMVQPRSAQHSSPSQ